MFDVVVELPHTHTHTHTHRRLMASVRYSKLVAESLTILDYNAAEMAVVHARTLNTST